MNDHPASSPRRHQWLADLKSLRPNMVGKFWVQMKADLIKECDGALQQAQMEGRDFTADEQAWYEAARTDLEYVNGQLGAIHQREDEEFRRRGLPVVPRNEWGQRVHPSPASADFQQVRTSRQQTPGPQGRRYHELFANGGDMAGFASGEEFLSTVASGLADPRIAQLNAAVHLEGVPAQGGFVVPGALAAEWLDAAMEDEIVRPRCRVFPMQTNELKIAGFDVSDMSTSAPFGFKADWADENTDATVQVGKFRMVRLNAKKLRLYTEASNELVADGQSFESQVGQAMIQAISWGLDDACLASGTGAGQPLAVLADPALVVISKETGQQPATIVYENIVKMYSRLHPSAMKGAVWCCSSTALPALLTMSLAIGTSGAFLPTVKESDGNFTLLGLPLLPTEKLPVIGSQGDIVLVNFQHAALGLRKEVVLETSQHVGWGRDVLSLHVILRADFQGLWNKAQTPKLGSTRSWCVTLAARP
jgi:HK97 family phage major capsid protein